MRRTDRRECLGVAASAVLIVWAAALVPLAPMCKAQAPKTDKTLVSWVVLTDKGVRAGSVLTVQVGERFDGIVFAERAAGKWMAGSNNFRRMQQRPEQNAAETADRKTVVQMAIVYQGDRIRMYRNGKPYAAYETENIDLLSSKDAIAVFGLRHIGGGGSIAGRIEDARIYRQALTAEQLQALRPNQPSAIEPYAWWDFEGDKVTDRAGRFVHHRMKGGAKLADGKLVLARDAVLVAAVTEAGIKATPKKRRVSPKDAGPYVEETPAMPKDVPATWLTYHLAHPGPGVGMPGDPNCAFFYKGRYHLHYIYKHKHGFAFAHVSSTDMVHWKWHPTVLVGPRTGHGMFSGTGFFTKDGKPAIIYHGQGSGRNYIAFGLDANLDKWTQPVAVAPKTKSGEEPTMRHWDPDCWLNGDTYYAISGGKGPMLLKSPDLETWTFLGPLLHEDMPKIGVSPEEDISCANMFPIGDQWMLLCISHQLGCRYYLGGFKGEKYLPTFHAMMNWNKWDFFAPESLLTPDGRRVMWAWCKLPGAQSAIQSLPRELSLPADGVLRIKPLRELESLRYAPKTAGPIVVKSGTGYVLKDIAGDTLELSVTLKPTSAQAYGVAVFCDKDGQGFPITIRPERKALTMGKIAPPFELAEGEDLALRIFLDKGMVEVFLNDRQAAVYMSPHDKAHVGIRLFSEGDDIDVSDVKAWKMKSIYPKAASRPTE